MNKIEFDLYRNALREQEEQKKRVRRAIVGGAVAVVLSLLALLIYPDTMYGSL